MREIHTPKPSGKKKSRAATPAVPRPSAVEALQALRRVPAKVLRAQAKSFEAQLVGQPERAGELGRALAILLRAVVAEMPS